MAELERKFKGAKQIYGILNFNHKFLGEAQLRPQTSKMIISVLKLLYPVQFNPLSYVACYVGMCCHIWSIIANKNQHFYKFDCYKSFTLMKLNDVQFLRKVVDPNIFIIHVQNFLFWKKKLCRHKLKFYCVMCEPIYVVAKK